LDGEIIAIHSRISEKSDQNFHVPIECFHTNWEFYRTGEILTFNKLVDMGFLGVGCEKTDAGLIVLNVIKGSAADRIGLVKNDLLLTVDGEKLDSVEELTILISNKQPDESILLEFQRDGIALSEKVTLGARPKEENK
jgi:S1-C subfamily serine protease